MADVPTLLAQSATHEEISGVESWLGFDFPAELKNIWLGDAKGLPGLLDPFQILDLTHETKIGRKGLPFLRNDSGQTLNLRLEGGETVVTRGDDYTVIADSVSEFLSKAVGRPDWVESVLSPAAPSPGIWQTLAASTLNHLGIGETRARA